MLSQNPLSCSLNFRCTQNTSAPWERKLFMTGHCSRCDITWRRRRDRPRLTNQGKMSGSPGRYRGLGQTPPRQFSKYIAVNCKFVKTFPRLSSNPPRGKATPIRDKLTGASAETPQVRRADREFGGGAAPPATTGCPEVRQHAYSRFFRPRGSFRFNHTTATKTAIVLPKLLPLSAHIGSAKRAFW
jgi:hypothetical protein